MHTHEDANMGLCMHLNGVRMVQCGCFHMMNFRPIPKYMKVYAQWAWVCIAMHYLQGLL